MSTEVTPENDLHMQSLFVHEMPVDLSSLMNQQPMVLPQLLPQLQRMLMVTQNPKERENSKRVITCHRTPEQRAKHAERERIRRAKLSDTRASELRNKHAERERVRRQTLPADKLSLERAKHAERERLRRRNFPEEVLRAQRAKRSERQKSKRLSFPSDLQHSDSDPVHVLSSIIPQEEIFDAVLTCTPIDPSS